ncbi:MAG: GNAT family N-acetyltransferase, partial [Bacillota bacterium]
MIPILETERLILRPFVLTDTQKAAQLFGDKRIAETTLIVPYPFTKEEALSWISTHQERAAKGEAFIFAVVLKSNNELVGTAMIRIDEEHNRGELSYWFGVSYWGCGYATEAAKRIIKFGFEELDLNRIWAAAMTKNPASMKVMSKA